MSNAVNPYTDPDERYVFEERLGILCGNGEPTSEDLKMAHEDVERFRMERTDLPQQSKKGKNEN